MAKALTTPSVEHVDLLIIGAGISGIGAAYHLQRNHPGKTYAILEARGATGGTWDLFRYPGIRSDSDLHTFGYAFKPWEQDTAIAGAGEILDYLREAASENGIDRHVRLSHRVLGAAWCNDQARWVVDVERSDTDEQIQISCGWLFWAGGYYNHDEGFTPQFDGTEDFEGRIVHPQAWPEDLDHAGKRVVVIGSGATAVTLIPALSETAAHVTMLQRSPSYILSVPEKDVVANALRKLLSKDRAYAITRRKNVLQQRAIYAVCKRYPRLTRRLIRRAAARRLPEGFAVDTHFNPSYDPWDQRLCAVPNGDLFKAISAGRASVVTDRIKTFTANGLVLESGEELEADIIVTATGLNMRALGGIPLTVDGAPVCIPETTVFRNMLLSDVPNFAFAFGYSHLSWTLKVDLVCDHLCRLLAHMDAGGHNTCRAVADPGWRLARSSSSPRATSSARWRHGRARGPRAHGGCP